MYQQFFVIVLLTVGIVFLTVAYHMKPTYGEFFGRVPVGDVHTMRVWEDGSYEIVYKDNSSEMGCVPEGLCND